jgi:hypothetical protein
VPELVGKYIVVLVEANDFDSQKSLESDNKALVLCNDS